MTSRGRPQARPEPDERFRDQKRQLMEMAALASTEWLPEQMRWWRSKMDELITGLQTDWTEWTGYGIHETQRACVLSTQTPRHVVAGDGIRAG